MIHHYFPHLIPEFPLNMCTLWLDVPLKEKQIHCELNQNYVLVVVFIDVELLLLLLPFVLLMLLLLLPFWCCRPFLYFYTVVVWQCECQVRSLFWSLTLFSLIFCCCGDACCSCCCGGDGGGECGCYVHLKQYL